MKKPHETPTSPWLIWLQLTWRWLVGGPRLVRSLGSAVLAAKRAQQDAEDQARDDRREVFKNWSLVCAASDNTVIRIRPGTMSLHVQGPINDSVLTRFKEVWKESPLLIRLPFPIIPTITPHGTKYVTVGDWKLVPYTLFDHASS
jgi:hypothetical protein